MSSTKKQRTEFKFLEVKAGMTSDDLKKPCVIKVGANWCGPCKTMEPDYVKLAKKYEDEFYFYKADVDEAENFADELKITTIPKVIFMKDDENIVMSNKLSDIDKKIKEFLKEED